jgi:hypothetical protein
MEALQSNTAPVLNARSSRELDSWIKKKTQPMSTNKNTVTVRSSKDLADFLAKQRAARQPKTEKSSSIIKAAHAIIAAHEKQATGEPPEAALARARAAGKSPAGAVMSARARGDANAASISRRSGWGRTTDRLVENAAVGAARSIPTLDALHTGASAARDLYHARREQRYAEALAARKAPVAPSLNPPKNAPATAAADRLDFGASRLTRHKEWNPAVSALHRTGDAPLMPGVRGLPSGTGVPPLDAPKAGPKIGPAATAPKTEKSSSIIKAARAIIAAHEKRANRPAWYQMPGYLAENHARLASTAFQRADLIPEAQAFGATAGGLGGAGLGALLGGVAGYTANDENRMRRALIGALLGGTAGGAVGAPLGALTFGAGVNHALNQQEADAYGPLRGLYDGRP